MSFSTNLNTTEVTTSAVTNISSTSATFNGSIPDAGLPAYTERGFCYSTEHNPTIANNKLKVSGTGEGNFSLQVNNLQYPVLYYVCAYAIQDGNVIYGNTVSFSTEFNIVSVTTSSVTEITSTSAKLNGIITDAGSPSYTQRGFCYSTNNPAPTISDNKVSSFASSTGSFSSTINNLEKGKTYYVRAFAYQDNRYVYGSTVYFKTNEDPSVSTDGVTSLTKYDPFGGGFFYQWKATFNGTVISSGSPEYSKRGFVYGTTIDPTVGNGTNISLSGSGTGRFSTTVDDLADSKIYYVRAYVKVGNKYYYGESVKISTF